VSLGAARRHCNKGRDRSGAPSSRRSATIYIPPASSRPVVGVGLMEGSILERTCQSLDRRARKADVARRISQEVENILPFIFPTFPASSVTSFRSAESPLSDGRPPLFLSVVDGGVEKTGINKPHARGVRFGDRVSRLSLDDRPPPLADDDTLYRSSYPRRRSTLSSETPHCRIARRHVARAIIPTLSSCDSTTIPYFRARTPRRAKPSLRAPAATKASAELCRTRR